MVSGERCLAADDEWSTNNMKEMIGGCCVCSDERGWAENPLVYCDGHGCNVAVHQACYGIVQVPTGPWFCRKCESQERAARVRCELCPHKDGALKRTDNGGWAHVVCALYIPEVEFANVSTMEPIVLQSVPHDRYNKTCYICEDQGRESKAATGACMTCNKHGCRQAFHVTCAQFAGLLCEEQGSDADNVKYCGYCKYHHSKLILFRLSETQERDRHKPKHKKISMDQSPSRVLPNIMVPESGSSVGGVPSLPTSSQKRLDDGSARFTTANFQEVSSALSGGSKDGLAAADAGKAASSEAKNKKNIVPGHVVGQRGGRKSLSSSGKPLLRRGHHGNIFHICLHGAFHQDFLSFSDPSLRPGGGTTFSSPPSFSSCLVKPSSEGGASEGTATLFGSLVSATTASAVGGKLYENSHSLTSSETPSLGTEVCRATAAPRAPEQQSYVSSDPPDVAAAARAPRVMAALLWAFVGLRGPAPPPHTHTPSSAGVKGGQGQGLSLEHRGVFSPALTGRPRGLELPLSAARTSLEVTEMMFLVCVWLERLNTSSQPFCSFETDLIPPDAPPSNVSPHPSVSGSVFNLAPSHMFGNRLNPNSAMAALIAQSEASPAADQEVGDGSSGIGAQGFSIRASPKTTPALLPPLALASSLTPHTHTCTLSLSLSPLQATLSQPTITSPIGGLQIRYDSSGSLPGPALGLLGAGGGGGETLPPVATSIEQLLERQWNEGQSFLLQQGAQGGRVTVLQLILTSDPPPPRDALDFQKVRAALISDLLLGMLKALHQLQEENRRLEEQIKNLTMKKERLQLLSAQLSGAISEAPTRHFLRQLRTELPAGATAAAAPPRLSPPPPSVSQSPPQLNGRVTGLMGALGAGSALGMGGIVGGLNGVIQNPAGPPHTPAAATMPAHNSRSPPPPRSSSMSSAQLPINNQSAITANPFLAMQHAHADSQKPRLGEKALGVAGQEKT
ncbi:hypothetical protein KUCAC02_017731 [Chaenocephalus aceratus]|uniref:Uncharacterized protein n=1 Tax=Chaenocephalus aceratus TaxID=36190 RepID=A0ACB9W2P8_CHAAC|nr:hypothetical protein KUCAC02_017731 [Chaenocephalus aceratus]